MKLRILAFIFTIVGLSFASCNKDNDAVNPAPPNGGGGNPPTNTISVPSTLTFTETGAGRSNTEIKYSYEYQNGKPSKVTVTGGSNPHTITFEYSPSNPNQLIQTIRTEGATTITEAYIYNANTIEVSHNGNLYSTITLGDKQITEVIGSATNTYHYDNEGNITSVTGTDNETITYDGKSNYFASLNLSSAQAFLVADKLNPYSRVKCLTQNPATISGGYEFIYTYNDNNTPSSATIGLNGTQILSSTTIYKNIMPPVVIPQLLTRIEFVTFDGRYNYTSTFKYDTKNRLEVYTEISNIIGGATHTSTTVLKYNNNDELSSYIKSSYFEGEKFEPATYTFVNIGNGIIHEVNDYNDDYTVYNLQQGNVVAMNSYPQYGDTYLTNIYYNNPSNNNQITGYGNTVSYQFSNGVKSPLENTSVKQLYFIESLLGEGIGIQTYIGAISLITLNGETTNSIEYTSIDSNGFPLKSTNTIIGQYSDNSGYMTYIYNE